MIDEEMKELDKLRTLLLATLDYLLKYYVGSMVLDQWDPSVDHYLQEKQKTEKDYKDANLQILEQRLNNWIRYLRDRMDLNFESYIKDQTGYEIDIFKQLPRNVAAIVSKGKIEDDGQLKSVESLIQVYRDKSVAKAHLDILVDLVDEYAKNKPTDRTLDKEKASLVKYAIVQLAVPPAGSESTIVRETSGASKEMTEEEFAKLQRDNGLLFEQYSPDHQWRKILIQTNGKEESALTTVDIALKGGSGCIYCAKGSSLPIKAYWKDNSTVVIEIKEDYKEEIKRNTVSSYEDLVKIAYVYK